MNDGVSDFFPLGHVIPWKLTAKFEQRNALSSRSPKMEFCEMFGVPSFPVASLLPLRQGWSWPSRVLHHVGEH